MSYVSFQSTFLRKAPRIQIVIVINDHTYHIFSGRLSLGSKQGTSRKSQSACWFSVSGLPLCRYFTSFVVKKISIVANLNVSLLVFHEENFFLAGICDGHMMDTWWIYDGYVIDFGGNPSSWTFVLIDILNRWTLIESSFPCISTDLMSTVLTLLQQVILPL